MSIKSLNPLLVFEEFARILQANYFKNKVCEVCGKQARTRCENKKSLERRCPTSLCDDEQCRDAHDKSCSCKRGVTNG